MPSNSIPVSRAEVFWHLADIGHGTAQEIADAIGLARNTVQSHLTALEKAGVIRGCRRPKRYRLSLNQPSGYLRKLQELEEVVRQAWRLRSVAGNETHSLHTHGVELGTSLAGPVSDINTFDQLVSSLVEQGYPVGVFDLKATPATVMFLFDSKEAAKEVAWALRVDWDGVTGVILAQRDTLALKTATELVRAKYCLVGDCCPLPNSSPDTAALSLSCFV